MRPLEPISQKAKTVLGISFFVLFFAAWAIAKRLASVRGAWAFRPQAEAAQATQRQPALATEVAT